MLEISPGGNVAQESSRKISGLLGRINIHFNLAPAHTAAYKILAVNLEFLSEKELYSALEDLNYGELAGGKFVQEIFLVRNELDQRKKLEEK